MDETKRFLDKFETNLTAQISKMQEQGDAEEEKKALVAEEDRARSERYFFFFQTSKTTKFLLQIVFKLTFCSLKKGKRNTPKTRSPRVIGTPIRRIGRSNAVKKSKRESINFILHTNFMFPFEIEIIFHLFSFPSTFLFDVVLW